MTVRPQHDVFRLDVAVHDSAGVRRGQSIRDLPGDLHGLRDFDRAAIEPRTQRLSLDELGHDERTAVSVSEVVDDQDVRVIERRGRFRFKLKATQPRRIRQGRSQETLQGDRTIEDDVLRAIDLAHSAGAHPRVDAVSADNLADEIVRAVQGHRA